MRRIEFLISVAVLLPSAAVLPAVKQKSNRGLQTYKHAASECSGMPMLMFGSIPAKVWRRDPVN
jgi:hypothetical protein